MARTVDPVAPPVPLPRRVVGALAAVVAGGAVIGFAAGAWNPWRLVRLQQFLSDPFFGLVVVHVSVLAAFVTHGDSRELRIWSGGWLTLRDAGRAGSPCGPTATARFDSEDLVHISSNYGDFDIRLDHRTGRPLNPMGPTCSG